MYNRRDFLNASGKALLAGLTGLSALVNSSDISATPHDYSRPILKMSDIFNDTKPIKPNVPAYTRETMIVSYQEWKAYQESKKSPPRTSKEIKDEVDIEVLLRAKAILIVKNEDRAFKFLTKEEKDYYEAEMIMLDDMEMVVARDQIKKQFGIDFTAEQFRHYKAPKILWFLDRHYGYRYSEEKAKTN